MGHPRPWWGKSVMSRVAARNLPTYNRVSFDVEKSLSSAQATMAHAARLLRAFCSRSRVMLAWKRRVSCTAFLLCAVSAQGQTQRRPTYERAEHLREALAAIPEQTRTRGDYNRVLNAFRTIYHTEPVSPKADASVLAVAGLLADEGHVFADESLLRTAIAQYEYLRTKYPASPYRFTALLSEGEIYRHDLGDRDNAKERFQQFLSSYPENPLAEQARIQLNDILAEETKRHPVNRSGNNAALASAIESQQPRPAMTPPPIVPQQVQAPAHAAPALTPPPIEVTPLPQLASLPETNGKVALVSGIRHWSTPVYTRIAIDLQNQVAYQAARVPDPDRIYFDLYGARLEPGLNGKSVEVIDDGFLKRIRAAQFTNNVTRIVLDVSSLADYSAFLLPNPWRLIIDIHGLKPGSNPTANLASLATAPPPVPAPTQQTTHATPHEIATLGQQPGRIQATDHPTTRPIAASVAGTVPAPQADDGSLASPAPPSSRSKKKPSPTHPAADSEESLAPPAHEAEPTAAGERSLVRTLGLKIGRIVIDAGHGGHDSGTTGPGGIEEKQVVLDVALRLGKLLKQRLGADVIFTRDNDTFIPLETRTAIANKAQADLFLSIHANSSPDSSARGVETYYLNFTTSPDALEVAARENAVSDESIHELSGLVKKITLKDKIDESREFAADVQKSLYNDLEDGNPGMRDRGVKKAPFVVLIGANMPSILAEISFLTNSADARELQQPAYRQRIAESLYRGVAAYIGGLSGVRLAQTSSLAR
jgi:N-acetylmuramoyl-L-alanine amidase